MISSLLESTHQGLSKHVEKMGNGQTHGAQITNIYLKTVFTGRQTWITPQPEQPALWTFFQ